LAKVASPRADEMILALSDISDAHAVVSETIPANLILCKKIRTKSHRAVKKTAAGRQTFSLAVLKRILAFVRDFLHILFKIMIGGR
jgi:hypothetical protein